MATTTFTAVLKHTDTTSFRAWGGLINTNLAVAGLVQTADTGQINWATAIYSATLSTNIGYEIWKLNDSLFGSAPVYIRLDYGTGLTSGTRPRLQLTVGTGTNGAGVITGTLTVARTITSSGQPLNDTTTYTSYICVSEGFVAFVGWYGVATTGQGYMGFIIQRTADSTGVPDSTGLHIAYHNGVTGTTTIGPTQTLGFGAAVTYNVVTLIAPVFVPHAEISSAIATIPQMYVGWGHFPSMQPLFGLGGVFSNEISDLATFSATILQTPRTYMSIGRGLGTLVDASNATLFGAVILWE